MNYKLFFLILVLNGYYIFVNSGKILEAARYYSLYRAPGRSHIEGDISNFNENLNVFSGCLIYAINFEGIDLPIEQHSRPPIVLARVDVVQAFFARKHLQLFYIPFEKTPDKLVNNTKLMTVKDWRTLAIRPYASLIRQSRPWKCEAHLYILPPWLREEIRQSSNLKIAGNPAAASRLEYFYFRILTTSELVLRHTLLPTVLFSRRGTLTSNISSQYASSVFCTQWRFDILVAEPEYDGVTAWLNGVVVFKLSLHLPPTSTWEIMHWHVNLVKTNNSSPLKIREIILFCHNCRKCDPLASVLLFRFNHPEIVMHRDNFLIKVREINRVAGDGNLTWKFVNFFPVKEEGTLEPLNLFNKGAFTNRNLFHKHGFIPSFNFYTEILLGMSLGNVRYHECGFTVQTPIVRSLHCTRNSKSCGCRSAATTLGDSLLFPNIMHLYEHLQTHIHFPLFRRRFTFASCGHLSGKLPFHELFSSYDTNAWIIVLIVAAFVLPGFLLITHVASQMLYFDIIRSNSKFHVKASTLLSRYVFNTLTYMVEQSPFYEVDMNVFRNVFPLRIIGSLTLLMGIIISNAYKGENFEKIISPTKPVPFRKFHELVSHKINIYTSWKWDADNFSKVIQAYKNFENEILPGTHCVLLPLKASGNKLEGKSIVVVSRLVYLLNKASPEESLQMYHNCSPALHLSKWERYILSVTSLLPMEKVHVESKHEHRLEGLQILLNCSQRKEAFIAPEDEVLYLRNLYNLNRSDFRGPLSFGQEFIEVKQIGIKLRGWIPENIIERFKALYSMGLVTYLETVQRKIYSERGTLHEFPDRLYNQFKPPNLGHSITVIFIVLPVGILLSLIAYCYETSFMCRVFKFSQPLKMRKWVVVFLKCLRFGCTGKHKSLGKRQQQWGDLGKTPIIIVRPASGSN